MRHTTGFMGALCALIFLSGTVAVQPAAASAMCIAGIMKQMIRSFEHCSEPIDPAVAARAARVQNAYSGALRRLYGDAAEQHLQRLETMSRPDPALQSPRCPPVQIYYLYQVFNGFLGPEAELLVENFIRLAETTDDVYRGGCL